MRNEIKYFLWIFSLGIVSIVYLESRFYTRAEASADEKRREKNTDRIIRAIEKLDNRLYKIFEKLNSP